MFDNKSQFEASACVCMYCISVQITSVQAYPSSSSGHRCYQRYLMFASSTPRTGKTWSAQAMTVTAAPTCFAALSETQHAHLLIMDWMEQALPEPHLDQSCWSHRGTCLLNRPLGRCFNNPVIAFCSTALNTSPDRQFLNMSAPSRYRQWHNPRRKASQAVATTHHWKVPQARPPF